MATHEPGESGDGPQSHEESAATLLERAGHYRTARALRRERSLSDALFDAAQTLIFVIDGNSRIIRSNPYAQNVSGYSRWELEDHDWRKLVPEDEQAPSQEFLSAAQRIGVNSRLTGRLITRDGSQRTVSWTAKALESVEPPASVVVVGHDLTDWQAAQQRTLESIRLATIGQMTATVAHEGRNALQRLSAGLERLAWRLDGRSELQELVDRMRVAKNDVTRLFDDIRNYAGPVQLEKGPCNLQQIWQSAWQLAAETMPGKKRELHENTGDIDLHLTADRFRLQQVFRNILENSLAACPDPVQVDIICRAASCAGRLAVQIAVRDNGPGLAAEQRGRIFEPFYTTKTHGSGLGMAIAKRIVEAHEGEITIGTPEQGAEILITLPRR